MSEPTKTVVITGTSSGFGEGAVRDFADRGYRVWGTMRDVNGRNATQKAALEAHSTNILIIEMDMNKDSAHLVTEKGGCATCLHELWFSRYEHVCIQIELGPWLGCRCRFGLLVDASGSFAF